MTDLQFAITRLRQADEQHPDFWNILQDSDADPQMIRDVVAVARAYVRKETVAHRALRIIRTWALCDTPQTQARFMAMEAIANKAAEGLGGMTQETGPIYGVPLIEFLPMGETMRQAMPSRDDLEDCIAKDCDRVAAGYEVLLAHYHKVCEERDGLRRLLSNVQITQALEHIELDSKL